MKYLGIAAENTRLQKSVSKGTTAFELCYKEKYFQVCSDIRRFFHYRQCSIFTSDDSLAEELHFSRIDKFEYEKTIQIKECDAVRITHMDAKSGAQLIQKEFSTSEIEKLLDTIKW